MSALTRPIAVLVSAALAVSITSPPAEAQSRRAGTAIGIAAGLGVLGLILSQQGARAKPQRQRVARPAPPPRATANQGPDLASVQRALAARGYDVGTPTGKAGPKTRAAIAAYQRDNGFPQTGKLDARQMAAIVAGAGIATAGFTAASAATSTEAAGLLAPVQSLQQSPILTAVEGGLASGPRELPVSPDHPAWASGLWTGTTTCWRRNYNIKMVVPAYSESATAKLEYSWQDAERRGSGGAGIGRGSGSMEMRWTRRGFEPINVTTADDRHPFGDVKLREGSERRPVFSSAACRGELALVRDPATTPKRQAPDRIGLTAVSASLSGAAGGDTGTSVAPQTASSGGIMGQWDGELKCTRGPNRQLFVRFGTVPQIAEAGTRRVDNNLMAADRPGRVAGQITQVVINNAGGSSEWTRLVGEFVEDSKEYRFVGVSSSGGDSPIRNLMLKQTEAGLEGTIAGETCTSLTATRPDPLASHEMPAVRLPANGGTFYAAREIGARCDALISWAAPAEKEFASQSSRGERINAAVLFADPAFIPVFGRTIESARSTTVGADIYNAIRECSRDPLTKPRMRFLESNVLHRVVKDDGFDWSGVTFVVRNVIPTRAALNRLNLARLEATRMNDLSDAIVHLASANVKFEAEQISLLPGQKAEISSSIKDILSSSGERFIEQEEARLAAEPAWSKLDALRSLRMFSSPATVHIKSDLKQKILTRLEGPERLAASELFSPMFAQAQTFPSSVEGIAEMDSLDASRLFALLSPAVRDPLQRAWNDHRDEKQKEAIGLELSRAIGAPRDHIGLQYGATWLTAFKQRWSAHQNSDVTKSALKFFFDDRKARLREALPSFQAAVSKAQPDAKTSLMDRFLVLPEDKRDPVSLEYELAVAGL